MKKPSYKAVQFTIIALTVLLLSLMVMIFVSCTATYQRTKSTSKQLKIEVMSETLNNIEVKEPKHETGEELVQFENIENTPFTYAIDKSQENDPEPHKILIGKYMVLKGSTKKEVIDKIKTPNWETITALCVILIENRDKLQNNEN